MSYQNVADALKNGADPDMLCMTCPWDRFCLTPPSITSSEVTREIEKVTAEARSRPGADRPGDQSVVNATLIAAMVLGGRDTAAQVCPVLAVRLRLPQGRHIVDGVKTAMQQTGRGGG